MAKAADKTPSEKDTLGCFTLAASTTDVPTYITNVSATLFGKGTDMAVKFAETMGELAKEVHDKSKMLKDPYYLSLAQSLLLLASEPGTESYNKLMEKTTPPSIAEGDSIEHFRKRAEKYFKNTPNPNLDGFIADLDPNIPPIIQVMLKKHLAKSFEACMKSRKRSKRLKILAVIVVAVAFACAQAIAVAANVFAFTLAGPLGTALTGALSLIGSAAAGKLIVDLGREIWEDKLRPDEKLENALGADTVRIVERMRRMQEFARDQDSVSDRSDTTKPPTKLRSRSTTTARIGDRRLSWGRRLAQSRRGVKRSRSVG